MIIRHNGLQNAVDLIIMSRNDRDAYYDTYPLVVSLNTNPENYRNHVTTHLLSESRLARLTPNYSRLHACATFYNRQLNMTPDNCCL